LRTLTNNTGIIEHSKFSIPNYKEGYTTDDNSRALVAVLKYYEVHRDPNVTELITTYLSFLLQMQKPDGAFYNLMDSDLHIHDDTSDDSQGRVLWASGYAVKSNIEAGARRLAKEIFDKGLKWSFVSSSPRIKAYALKGLHYYKNAFPSDPNVPSNLRTLAGQLTEMYNAHCSQDWCWFEPYLTYANAALPQALFLAYESTGKKAFLNVAKETLEFLIKVQMINGIFVPIGNKGWYHKGGNRPVYDQQPIEAAHMIEATSSAYYLTGDKKYQNIANNVFNWFLGKNLKGVVLYDRSTGGCFDGINPEGSNLNQGAESTISYLLARTEIEKMRHFGKSI
jgi:uncharacterized protein YyaL (SSP411 family)